MEVQRRRSPDWWVDYIVVGGGEIPAIVQQIVRGAHWEAANGPMEGSATKGGRANLLCLGLSYCGDRSRFLRIEICWQIVEMQGIWVCLDRNWSKMA